MSKKELTEEARQARNAYMKRWRSENKDKVAEYNAKFWQRKSDELKGLGEIADKDEKTAYIITLTGSNADVLEACKNPATGKIKAHRR